MLLHLASLLGIAENWVLLKESSDGVGRHHHALQARKRTINVLDT